MRSTVTVTLMMLVCAWGCDVVDPARPTAQPDVEVFGNLLDVEKVPDAPGTWSVRLQAGTPRAVRSAEEASGNPTPAVEKGIVATVAVGPDAVVVVDDRPGVLDDIASGTEIVILPVAGTTQMFGSNDLRLEAAMVMDFASYARWRLPKLEPVSSADPDDPAMINSSGAEVAPVPVAGGSVLYFSAHLRPPGSADEGWHGALREGVETPEEGAGPVERSYRTQLTDHGWAPPELVRFSGLDDAQQIRVTWVSADEKACLVTVATMGEIPWMGRSTRGGVGAEWSAPQRLDALGDDASDGSYLAGSTTKIVFVTRRFSGSSSDLFIYDPKIEGSPGALEPPIFTAANEWNPRTGPRGELFFCRDDRQLVFKDAQARTLRLPGPHRVQFTQAAVSDDGRWLFFCIPKLRTPEADDDIFVASIDDDFGIGEPVPVDDWRP